MTTTGVLALYGGGPFDSHDELDRTLLAAAGAERVVVLPTADAFEQPQRLVDAAEAWGTRVGVAVEPLMVLQRRDVDDAAIAAVDGASAVYLVGDSGLHLRSVLKDSDLLAAIERVLARGGLVVAAGASASALCDPMFDERGGAFTLGLGVVRGRAVIPDSGNWDAKTLERARQLADVPLAELPADAAIVRRGEEWSVAAGDVAGTWLA